MVQKILMLVAGAGATYLAVNAIMGTKNAANTGDENTGDETAQNTGDETDSTPSTAPSTNTAQANTDIVIAEINEAGTYYNGLLAEYKYQYAIATDLEKQLINTENSIAQMQQNITDISADKSLLTNETIPIIKESFDTTIQKSDTNNMFMSGLNGVLSFDFSRVTNISTYPLTEQAAIMREEARKLLDHINKIRTVDIPEMNAKIADKRNLLDSLNAQYNQLWNQMQENMVSDERTYF